MLSLGPASLTAGYDMGEMAPPRMVSMEDTGPCALAVGSGGVAKEAVKSLTRAVILGLLSVAVLTIFFMSMPTPEAWNSKSAPSFPPTNMDDAKALRAAVLQYGESHPGWATAGIALVYVNMQAYGIPGTTWLGILAGALFGTLRGLGLVSATSTAGCTAAYLVAWACGKDLAMAMGRDRIQRFAAEVAKRRRELLSYVVFLRVTPLLPNVFINIASPIVGVPLPVFAIGTLLGCLPNSFLTVNAGTRLGEVKQLSDFWDKRFGLLLAAAAAVAAVPVAWQWLDARRPREASSAAASSCPGLLKGACPEAGSKAAAAGLDASPSGSASILAEHAEASEASAAPSPAHSSASSSLLACSAGDAGASSPPGCSPVSSWQLQLGQEPLSSVAAALRRRMASDAAEAVGVGSTQWR